MTDDTTNLDKRLTNIEQTLEEIASENAIENLEPRTEVQPGSTRHKVLKFAGNNDKITAADCRDVVGSDVSRTLTHLYRSRALNRETNSNGKYVYEVTDLGERMLQTEQSRLDESAHEPDGTDPKPWIGTAINESQYKLLEIIDEASDAPQSSDVNGTFVERTSVNNEKGPGAAVTPYLTQLHKKELLDRTPIQPYRYWVTEKGKDLLDN